MCYIFEYDFQYSSILFYYHTSYIKGRFYRLHFDFLQVLDALVALFCRSNVSADVHLVGGWLFRQLLPHGEEEFTAFHLKWLKVCFDAF